MAAENSVISKNTVVCALEHVLRDEGCNEVVVAGVYARVKATRGNFNLDLPEFLAILSELESEGLYKSFGESTELSEDSLIARSDLHPSVPVGAIWRL